MVKIQNSWVNRYYESIHFRHNDLSKTCQSCQQLKLNLLSMQINIYCLMMSQTPALLVQHTPWTWAAVMLGLSLYFSHFLPNRPHPLSSFDTHPRWQPVTQSARSRRSYAKIEDCEQSKLAQTLCWLHVYLKVKWNVFWQGLSYVVLQQFPEKKKTKQKHDLTSVKSKPSKVISNYLRDPKKMIRHY